MTDGAACGEAAIGYTRFVFALPRPVMVEAVDRIAAALRDLDRLLIALMVRLAVAMWDRKDAAAVDVITACIVDLPTALVLQRQGKLCNFIEWKDLKIVYKRYASLYFCCLTDAADNELMTLESIHLFVECLDRYFGNVCELDLVFNFHKAYFILDEVFLGGQVQETSKKAVEHFIIAQDTIVEQEKMGDIPTGG